MTPKRLRVLLAAGLLLALCGGCFGNCISEVFTGFFDALSGAFWGGSRGGYGGGYGYVIEVDAGPSDAVGDAAVD